MAFVSSSWDGMELKDESWLRICTGGIQGGGIAESDGESTVILLVV